MIRILTIAIVALIVNCTTFQGSYAVLSNKEVDFSKNYEKIKPSEEGKSSFNIYFMIPIGTLALTERMNEALNEALTKSGGDFLKNAEIKSKGYYIPFIYGNEELIISGEVWKEAVATKGKKK
ncbi:hypothetical protein [Leptospira yasudae]|uniref:Uncharacterized protein n=1 Tax=Leptospira yasudae TaxID=2202201 RepID=A0A6N4QF16_9LEPT|nr:hypothetical protein [Leptospira yasudae]TGL75750.1 hypothetical protein EHQ72_15795 [Leptospira yasudae]TGL78253.1 hypothetical protein EHQ77_11865 [Leptospira yasudae]TGL80091.1 hypothetical protein EHQ83_17490 [Leptospira yasudae]